VADESVAEPRAYRWKEISDLPADLEPLRDRELEALCDVWTEQRRDIGEEQTEFSNQLRRQWAIETGIIEGVYTLDRGVTQTLIERGIESARIPHDATNRDPELVARIIQSHYDVLEGLFAFVKGERPLGTSYIKELHAALLRYQDTVTAFDQFGTQFEQRLEKGTYKTLPNNPRRPDGSLHEYCPPEHVAAEMDRLVQLHQRHVERQVRPQVEAAWLHHTFTQIHPFQDGNGRVARALASLVFLRGGFFPLVVSRDDRTAYIDALEKADAGDLPALATLFAQFQKRILTRAISGAIDLRPAHSLDEAVAQTRDLLVGVGRIVPAKYNAAKEMVRALFAQTENRLNGLVAKLHGEIANANPSFAFSLERIGQPSEGLRSISEKLHYDPNANDYHNTIALRLSAASVVSRIVVSFHGVGPRFRGLLVAAAYLEVGAAAPVPLVEDVFRISYEEPRAEVEKRYETWLEDSLIRGLEEWRRTFA